MYIAAFRFAWRTVNLLLVVSLVYLAHAAVWEWSVRQYLHGFSDAVVSAAAPPDQKIDAILHWMKAGPPRDEAARADDLSPRNPEYTLNYRQLLAVCGTATNAFLNLSRSSGLESRRLLLLTPDRKTKHVVAEVLVDGRWIVVDPSFRIVMRDFSGKALTRKELQDPAKLKEAIHGAAGYPTDYTYERYAHVRLARLPLDGFHLRKLLESLLPGWDENFDWSLLLERESFFVLVMTTACAVLLLMSRFLLAWYADRRLRVPRFHLRQHFKRATTAFLTTPEIQ
jgi:hypothetical protein